MVFFPPRKNMIYWLKKKTDDIFSIVLELQDKYITFTIKQNGIQISVSQIPLESKSKAVISSTALSLYFSFVLINGHDLVYVNGA